ncbi:MAG: hypothetical protein K0R99_3787 [Microbacterium sp.]|jgi:hypothetical protein|nr:hypothetical protein [Microbacterium sp.]MDF2562341.1 hypothetical protein [Microbacterium sp.]
MHSDSELTTAVLALGVTAATRNLSDREREAIRLARQALMAHLGASRD